MKNLTSFRKAVETGVDPRLALIYANIQDEFQVFLEGQYSNPYLSRNVHHKTQLTLHCLYGI